MTTENKNLKYALLGGAAVVGAAVLYYLTNSAESKNADGLTAAEADKFEENLDEDLEKIGEIEYEDGHIKFTQFLKIFEICSYHGKTLFAEQKKTFISNRRQALMDGDEAQYAQIVEEMTKMEETLVQNKLMSIIERLGITEQQFQMATMFHGQDQQKGFQIMQMQQQTVGKQSTSAEKPVPLTKQKTMEVFKTQQDIQLNSMDNMLADGAMRQPTSPEEEMKMMMAMMIQQCKSQDELFNKTGVEEEHLNHAIQTQNLQKDPEFMRLVQDNMMKVMAKAKQAEGGMGGMGGMMGGGGPPPGLGF